MLNSLEMDGLLFPSCLPFRYDQPDLRLVHQIRDDLWKACMNSMRYMGNLNVSIYDHLILCVLISENTELMELLGLSHLNHQDYLWLRVLVLLHDLHEGITGDICYPMKQRIKLCTNIISEIEDGWEFCIRASYMVEEPTPDMKQAMKRIDNAAVIIEVVNSIGATLTAAAEERLSHIHGATPALINFAKKNNMIQRIQNNRQMCSALKSDVIGEYLASRDY